MRPANFIKSFALCSLFTLSAGCGTSSAQYAADYDLRYDYQPYPPQAAQPDDGRYRYENYDYEDYDQEAPPPPTAEDPQVEPDQFREPLEQYGRWEENPEYGSVWIPSNVQPGWRPYTVGNWTYTDYGWTWVSYEPFGWATYHYGRWACLPNGAWAWVPGRVWGPAWVSWRYGDGYCGWAPLPPAHGFATSVEVWDDPFIPQNYYSFVGAGSLCSPYVNRYVLPHDRVNFYHRTHHGTRITVINHRVTNCGLDLGYVQKHGGHVEHGRIHTVHRPHDSDRFRGHDVAVYRPTHNSHDGDHRKREIVKVPRYPDNDRPGRAGNTSIHRAAVDRPTKEITPPARQSTPPKVDRRDDRDRTPVRVGPREFEYVSKDADDKPVARPPTPARKTEVERPSRNTTTDRPAPRVAPQPAPKVEARPAPKVEARPTPAPRPTPKVEARPTPAPSRSATDRPVAKPAPAEKPSSVARSAPDRPDRPARSEPARSEPARSSASSDRPERSSPRGDSYRGSRR